MEDTHQLPTPIYLRYESNQTMSQLESFREAGWPLCDTNSVSCLQRPAVLISFSLDSLTLEVIRMNWTRIALSPSRRWSRTSFYGGVVTGIFLKKDYNAIRRLSIDQPIKS